MSARPRALADRLAATDVRFLRDLCDRIRVDDGIRLWEIVFDQYWICLGCDRVVDPKLRSDVTPTCQGCGMARDVAPYVPLADVKTLRAALQVATVENEMLISGHASLIAEHVRLRSRVLASLAAIHSWRLSANLTPEQDAALCELARRDAFVPITGNTTHV